MAKQPKWVQQIVAQQKAQLRKVQNTAPIQQFGLHSRAPGWVLLRTEISCIPDVAHPWDPSVLRAIREIAPDLSPLWIKRTYRPPYDSAETEHVTFGRHGLGQKLRHSPSQHFECKMPTGANFPKPNAIYWEPWGDADPRARDLPGAYVPFDGRFLRYVKAAYREISVKDAQAMIMARVDAQELATLKHEQELGRMTSDLQRYVSKKLETISDVEMKEYFLHQSAKGL